MNSDLLIMDAETGCRSQVANYCATRGFRPRVVADYSAFVAAWQPGLRMVSLSLQLASMDGIMAIRFLAEKRCRAGLILMSDADPRILSAASRLARARGLRVLGSLSQPFDTAQLGTLLLHPEPDIGAQTMVLAVQLARDELRACIRQGLVKAWFQPKIEVRSLQFVAVEALVRLEHPDHGILRPAAFLALAEESGLIEELTEAVVRETLLWGARLAVGGTAAAGRGQRLSPAAHGPGSAGHARQMGGRPRHRPRPDHPRNHGGLAGRGQRGGA
jgi:hypothetical protein